MEDLEPTEIQFDVSYSWNVSPPVYRLYIDGDLYTERTFIWPGYQNYIEEHLWANLLPGKHKLRFENCTPGAQLSVKNIKVNGRDIGPNTEFELY